MTPITAIAIDPNGTVRSVLLTSLEDMQRQVGGWIELINFGTTGHFAYLNEEGKLENLPPNILATHLCAKYGVGLALTDYICGTLLVVGPPDSEGNDTSISPELAQELLQLNT